MVEKKCTDRTDDKTLIFAEEATKAMNQMYSLIRKILAGRCGEENVDIIIEEFVSGKYTHDRPFMAEDVKRLLGDCVRTDVPEEVYELMKLYRMEIGRNRPGVEYVPLSPKH